MVLLVPQWSGWSWFGCNFVILVLLITFLLSGFFFCDVSFESARHAPSIAPIFSKIWPMEIDMIFYENDLHQYVRLTMGRYGPVMVMCISIVFECVRCFHRKQLYWGFIRFSDLNITYKMGLQKNWCRCS